ncbi:hypothetical protein GX48_01636 [Paracoccidioides brasiliensis]|nr:hypothetical protein GX48_01636 [Paracoccidioides brasiliensis]
MPQDRESPGGSSRSPGVRSSVGETYDITERQSSPISEDNRNEDFLIGLDVRNEQDLFGTGAPNEIRVNCGIFARNARALYQADGSLELSPGSEDSSQEGWRNELTTTHRASAAQWAASNNDYRGRPTAPRTFLPGDFQHSRRRDSWRRGSGDAWNSAANGPYHLSQRRNRRNSQVNGMYHSNERPSPNELQLDASQNAPGSVGWQQGSANTRSSQGNGNEQFPSLTTNVGASDQNPNDDYLEPSN